jgi:tetratricopeptide (TPR) repeat protein
MAYAALNHPEKALSDFKKSNQLVTTAEACYQIGAINYKIGEMETAKAALEKARLIRDDLENMNFYLGMIYFKEKRYEDSYKCFHDYTDHNRNNPEAFYYQAYSEAKLGKNNEASLSLRMATIYQSKDWKYYYKMYDLYMAMGDKPNALNNISMVIDLGEHKREYYQQRSQLYAEAGDSYRAKEDSLAAEQAGQTAAESPR